MKARGIPMIFKERNRLARAHRCASFLLLTLSVFLPTSCLAPSRSASAPPARPEPELPYESIAASVAVGDPEKALAEYDASLKAEAQSRQTRLLHARLLLIAGKYDDAQGELEALLAEDGKDSEVLYNLSVLAGVQGSVARQKEYLQRTVEVNPAHADALAALGDIALSENDSAKAALYFQRALSSDPANFLALRGQGAVYTQTKEYQKAVEVLSRAITAQPDYAFSYIDRARAESALGNSRDALTDYSRAIEIDPTYSWSYIDRGRLYVRSGKLDQAVEDFTVAIELAPEIFLPYALRAEILYQKGRYEEARADFGALLSLKPDYYFAFEPNGVLLYMKGDWQGARKAFQDAYRYFPDDHSYALLAALTLRREGKPAQAADYVNSILKGIPRESLYWEAARFLMDPASGSFPLTARLDAEKNKVLRARMLFFMAEQAVVDGKTRAARDYLFDIENAKAPDSPEIILARWELKTLMGPE